MPKDDEALSVALAKRNTDLEEQLKARDEELSLLTASFVRQESKIDDIDYNIVQIRNGLNMLLEEKIKAQELGTYHFTTI